MCGNQRTLAHQSTESKPPRLLSFFLAHSTTVPSRRVHSPGAAHRVSIDGSKQKVALRQGAQPYPIEREGYWVLVHVSLTPVRNRRSVFRGFFPSISLDYRRMTDRV
ncbi:hypothetical protein GWI33_020380 [Rhynchophorus ferrugineus]|uniref:Uncharacterized protein n=1 Tax=Rhynchophorus ferrugineus TaxID=354439 RepID=A0A834I3L6_RHYFE|nr:hypothetical protein GWI33_020380 [Rhynchophorus ferrugineus]